MSQESEQMLHAARLQKQVWSAVAELLAISTRVEGMKATNQYRLARGEAIAYDEDAFEAQAHQMAGLGGYIGAME